MHRFDIPIVFTIYAATTQLEAAEEAQNLMEEIRNKVKTKFVIAVAGTPVKIEGHDPAGL